MIVRHFKWIVIVCGLMGLMGLGLTSCSVLKRRPDASADASPSRGASAPSAVYLDFADILVPAELKMNRKLSFVFETPNLTAGVLSLRGRLTAASLIQFFETNMAKDNWQATGSFRSPRSLLLFEKGNRWCLITVSGEGYDLYTHVEIWVAPRVEEVGAGLLK